MGGKESVSSNPEAVRSRVLERIAELLADAGVAGGGLAAARGTYSRSARIGGQEDHYTRPDRALFDDNVLAKLRQGQKALLSGEIVDNEYGE